MTLSVAPFVDQIYEGVLDEDQWRALLQHLNEKLPASTACISVESTEVHHPPYLFLEGGKQDSVDLYTASMYASDPFTNLPEDRAMSIDEVIDFQRWRKSDFYRMCVEPPGLRFFIGVDTAIGQHSRLKLRFGRTPAQGAFSEGNKKLLEELARHLQRALRIKSSLGTFSYQLATQSEALERLSVGTLVITETLDLVGADQHASAILEKHPAIGLRDGKLAFGRKATQQRFVAALEEQKQAALKEIPGTATFLKVAGDGATDALGLAIRSLDKSGREMASANTLHFGLYIGELRPKGSTNQQALQTLFGLTPKESSLSLLLVDGHTLESAAAVLGMKPNTARAHLRAIFLKTGVSRQSQLVSTIMGSLAGF